MAKMLEHFEFRAKISRWIYKQCDVIMRRPERMRKTVGSIMYIHRLITCVTSPAILLPVS